METVSFVRGIAVSLLIVTESEGEHPTKVSSIIVEVKIFMVLLWLFPDVCQNTAVNIQYVPVNEI